jgi:hypothetical protein
LVSVLVWFRFQFRVFPSRLWFQGPVLFRFDFVCYLTYSTGDITLESIFDPTVKITDRANAVPHGQYYVKEPAMTRKCVHTVFLSLLYYFLCSSFFLSFFLVLLCYLLMSSDGFTQPSQPAHWMRSFLDLCFSQYAVYMDRGVGYKSTKHKVFVCSRCLYSNLIFLML